VLKKNKNNYQVFIGGLHSFPGKLIENKSDKYQIYYDNCYRYNNFKYPTFTYFIEWIIGNNTFITFLKTDEGYKLIEIDH
jgi:hypothetical protein